jgi:uncharacterized protein (DUF4415 family)
VEIRFESSALEERENMSNLRTVTLSQLRRRKGKTDWKRVRESSDADINSLEDADWEEFKNIDWSKAEIVVPVKKEPISIRVDTDVLEFFRKAGDGYQGRINAVLRSFMNEKRKTTQQTKKKKRA